MAAAVVSATRPSRCSARSPAASRAHRSAPNSAGTTAPPLPAKDDDKNKPQSGGDTNHTIGSQNGGINTGGGDVHITAPNPEVFASDKPQNTYPWTGGR
jgi:hypothetical protein